MAALHRDQTSLRKNSALVYSEGKRKEAGDETCCVNVLRHSRCVTKP